jgi:hypothetical protein
MLLQVGAMARARQASCRFVVEKHTNVTAANDYE